MTLAEERQALPVAAGPLPSVDDLVRIATDCEPDVGDFGPELVLGPWADLADPWSRRVAVAWTAWLAPKVASPLDRYARDKGVAKVRREALHAAARAPVSVYDAEGRDLCGVGAAAPDGPLLVPEPPALAGAWLCGRAARGPRGWELLAPVAVPADPAALARAWDEAATAAGAAQTRADALRAAGHVLLTSLLTSAWRNGRPPNPGGATHG